MRLTRVQTKVGLTFDHLLFQYLTLDFHLDRERRSHYRIYWSATPLLRILIGLDIFACKIFNYEVTLATFLTDMDQQTTSNSKLLNDQATL